MDIKELKKQLDDLTPLTVTALQEVLENKTSGAKNKIEAVKLIYDRIGLPALKASITKNIMAPQLPEALDSEREALLESKQETEEEIAKIREQLNHAAEPESSDSLHIQG
jgi:hypothetical protein